MDEALIPFLTMGCPILHEYTSTTPAQRYSHVTPHTYELRDLQQRLPVIGSLRRLEATWFNAKTQKPLFGPTQPATIPPDRWTDEVFSQLGN